MALKAAWQHKPLEIRSDMPPKMRAARLIHNALRAYDDARFAAEHELAARHFDAIARGDKEAASAALADRIALGFPIE